MTARFISTDSKKHSAIINIPQNPAQAKLVQVFPNGNKFCYLPIDKMPCIKPGKEQYADNMALTPKKYVPQKNQNYRKFPDVIPNPAYPRKIIPESRK